MQSQHPWLTDDASWVIPNIPRSHYDSYHSVTFHCYVFTGLWTASLHSVLSSTIVIYLPLSYADYIGLPRSFLLIHYHHYRRSSLTLSCGWSLIVLSLWRPLSCMIHRSPKQCYSTLGLCPLASVALPARSRLQVYKLYQYSTWTLSLSFCAIRTSEPNSKELHKSVNFPVSLLSAAV